MATATAVDHLATATAAVDPAAVDQVRVTVDLVQVEQGLLSRANEAKTIEGYRSKVCRMQQLMWENKHEFENPFELAGGLPLTWDSKIWKWKLPLSYENGTKLFSLISICPELASKKRKIAFHVTNIVTDSGDSSSGSSSDNNSGNSIGRNPAADLITVGSRLV